MIDVGVWLVGGQYCEMAMILALKDASSKPELCDIKHITFGLNLLLQNCPDH